MESEEEGRTVGSDCHHAAKMQEAGTGGSDENCSIEAKALLPTAESNGIDTSTTNGELLHKCDRHIELSQQKIATTASEAAESKELKADSGSTPCAADIPKASAKEEGSAAKGKVFKKRSLGKNLPPSIPLIHRSNYEYDSDANALKRKQDARDSEVKMQLYPKAARLLGAIKKPVAVVSICGRYRSGKSYFLSRMLGSSNAFSLGHTMHACTFGIWVGTTVLECDEYVLLLLDTEGIDALGTSGASDASILVMTILLSSYMIYNSLQVPTRSDLEKMSCFTELSRSISIRSGEDNEDMTDFRAHFPDFLWLLRDVTLETTDKKTGKVLTATEFLKTQVLFRSRKTIPDIADNVVMCIRNYFPSIECMKLPPPTAKKEVMNNIAEREDELTPEFLVSMETAIEYVLQAVKVKRGFNGNTLVNGSTLVDLAKQYLEAVNLPNAVPSLDLSWQSVVDTQLRKLQKSLLAEYSNDMQKALKGKLPLDEGRKDDGYLNTSTLTGIHEGILASKRARLEREMSYLLPVNMHEKLHVKSFDSRKADFLASFELQVVTYEEIEEVERVADGLFFKFVQQNYNESVTFCTELFQQLLQPIEKSIKESLKSGGKNGYTFENLQDDAENMHRVYEERARGPAKDFIFKEKKESILDRHMQMYETMIGFSKELLEARQEAFEANRQAIEARQKVDELERDIRELEQKLMLKQQELDTVRKDQERVIRELERDLNKQIEEERHKFEELSKATELQDEVSAEASKQKVQEMQEEAKQIMQEMKAEQQKRVGELAKEISETRDKLELMAAKQSKNGSCPERTDAQKVEQTNEKKGKKDKKMKTKMIDGHLYDVEEKRRSICTIL